MACIFEIQMGTSDVIAFFALLVAILSALCAYLSWKEAKKTNQISLFVHKKEIYDAFFDLKMHMMQKAEFAELEEVFKFYYPSRNANIYLPTELAKNIETYYRACFNVANIHRRYGGLTTESRGEYTTHLEEAEQLAPKIESELIKLLQQVQA
jgi:hypothetical protein